MMRSTPTDHAYHVRTIIFIGDECFQAGKNDVGNQTVQI